MMKSAILILSIFIVNFAQGALNTAGTVDGGGGKGVVCKDPFGVIQSVEMLDLYEGQALYGLTIPKSSMGAKEQVQQIQRKMAGILRQSDIHFDPLVERVQSIMRLTPSGVAVKPVDDAFEVIAPTNCQIEQVANYVDDSLLIVNGDFWNKMDEQNKAALIIHEALYRHQLNEGAKDSRRSRKIVAHLFSDFKFVNPIEGLNMQRTYCEAIGEKSGRTQYAFYLSPQRHFVSKLQFLIYKGKTVFSKKVAVLPKSYPWSDSVHAGNATGGDVESNFEGNDFFAVAFDKNLQTAFVVVDDIENSRVHCDKSKISEIDLRIEQIPQVIPAMVHVGSQTLANFIMITEFNYLSNFAAEAMIRQVRLEVAAPEVVEDYFQVSPVEIVLPPRSAGVQSFKKPLIFAGLFPTHGGEVQASLVFEGTTRDGASFSTRARFRFTAAE